jgi:glycosyltransferase involved in cell wall biosynthesis
VAAPDLVEVLVCNDGGDPAAGDVTRKVIDGQGAMPFVCHYRHLNHRGPAAVRNEAARQAKGEVLLFLNDDVTLHEGHLRAHLEFHAAARASRDIPRWKGAPLAAARGVTRWAADSLSSPLMRWLARQSFFYYLITDLGDIGYEYYHTCDLSIARKLVIEAAPFDEAFPHAAFEDTEWGWRLEKLGMRLSLLQHAVSEHHHVYDEAGLVRRSYTNGVCAALLCDRVPELRHRAIDDFIRPEEIPGGRLARRGQRSRALLRRTWELVARGFPHDSDMPVEYVRRTIRAHFSTQPLSSEPGPVRWAELARREHVVGFLCHHQRLKGIPYPW